MLPIYCTYLCFKQEPILRILDSGPHRQTLVETGGKDADKFVVNRIDGVKVL